MEEVCIFIDGSNLYHQLKEHSASIKLDYYRFSKALAGSDRHLIRTYYYVCPPTDPQQESYHDQQKFFSYLHNTPYLQLQFGSLESRGDIQVEKGIDVRIAIDMVSLAHQDVYDTAILLTNDADLVPAVEMVKNLGKHVEYVYLTRKTALLVEACDLVVAVDDKILQKSRGK